MIYERGVSIIYGIRGIQCFSSDEGGLGDEESGRDVNRLQGSAVNLRNTLVK